MRAWRYAVVRPIRRRAAASSMVRKGGRFSGSADTVLLSAYFHRCRVWIRILAPGTLFCQRSSWQLSKACTRGYQRVTGGVAVRRRRKAPEFERTIDANQIVGANFRLARELRGWTQE